ncbi:MAG: NAD(P)-binding protein [Myxococcales bacterium]|nr:NAD(P)-binding protein [Myxococcales bacterium]
MSKRIAVLGGGMSSLVTVFELTSLPRWQDDYEITVYQTGWRLGGKGASGRNAHVGQRIEEHGLHILFGFYDNAFRVMRACYEELGRNPSLPLASWRDAFKPQHIIAMLERVEHGGAERYTPWVLEVPPNDELPGDGESGLPGPFGYIARIFEMIVAYFAADDDTPAPAETMRAGTMLERDLDGLRARVSAMMHDEQQSDDSVGLLEGIGNLLRSTVGKLLTAADEVSDEIEDRYGMLLAEAARRLALVLDEVVDDIIDAADIARLRWLVERFQAAIGGAAWGGLRRARVLADLGAAMVRGMLVDELLAQPVNWFKIDHLEFRDWLRQHGASEETIESPLVVGVYDAAFSYFGGAGAGSALHGLLRMLFTYKGSVLWKMQAGMGDVIFAPLYEVLRRRGVRFEFFHEVQRLELSDDGQNVERVVMREQMHVREGARYKPLVDVKRLPCWPSEPRYEQLERGAALRDSGENLENWWGRWEPAGERTLERGRDFDAVVLGISIGAFPYICRELIDNAAKPRFGQMVRDVKTTQTQALQLWLGPDAAGLGWDAERWPRPVLCPYREPFDTWADMSHLIEREDFPPSHPVGHLAYLCSPFPDSEAPPPRDDHAYPARQRQRVFDNAASYLEHDIAWLWPKAVTPANPSCLNWYLLVDLEDRDGRERLQSQYWYAPLSPSDRYVLGAAGSVGSRLRADESGYDNLYLTGDWTLTSMSLGCLEGATMGGIQAARAIDPRVAVAAGDWLAELPRDAVGAAGPALAPTGPLRVPRVQGPGLQRRALRRYIDRDGAYVASAPVDLEVDVTMFALNADYGALRRLADAHLNAGGNSETIYRPLAPMCVCYASRLVNKPTAAPVADIAEIDFGFWVPLVAGRDLGGLFVPERVVTYTPYIWVDSGLALYGGRSVFGFPKALGYEMTMPGAAGEVAEMSFSALQVRNFAAPQARGEVLPTLQITRTDHDLWEELEGVWQAGANLLDAARDKVLGVIGGEDELALPTWDSIKQLAAETRDGGMRMVFLKQFRDAVQDDSACYQAVLEAPFPIVEGSFSGGWLPGDFDIKIYRYDSLKVVENLGLRVGPEQRDAGEGLVWQVARPFAQGWAKFRSCASCGEIVWERR